MKRLLILSLAGMAIIGGGVAVQSLADVGGTPSADGLHGRWHQFSPRQVCIERYAREAGHLAYLEARLDLTPDEQPLWDKWRQASIAGAASERDQCVSLAPAPGMRLNAIQREAFTENMLALKVDNMKSSRPELVALYAVLTPEQKAILDRQGGEHRHRWSHPDAGGDGHDTL